MGRELVNCWIRGELRKPDIKGDQVRQAVQACPYRQGIYRPNLFGDRKDYFCTHPAQAQVSTVHQEEGSITVGTLTADFATFCIPVDLHRRKIGQRSQLIIQQEDVVVKKATFFSLRERMTRWFSNAI